MPWARPTLTVKPLARPRADAFRIEPNVLIDNPAQPRYAAIDFGIVGTLDPRDQGPEEERHVLVDEGPLVLVETRKDLSQLKLPFEQQGG